MNLEARYMDHAMMVARSGQLDWLARTAWKYLAIPAGKAMGQAITGPILGGLLLNYRCNLKCNYCSYWKITDPAGEMSTERALDLIQQFRDIGTSGIGLMGGEPLLRKDAYQVIRKIKDLRMTCSTTTNGYPLTNDNVARLMDTGIDFIAVSLDSPRKEIHDRLRGVPGAYEKALDGLRNLVEHRNQNKLPSQIILNTVISGTNFMDVPSMVSLAKELGVDHIYFLGVDLAPASVSTDHLEMKEEYLDKLREVLDFLTEEKKKNDFINTSLRHLKLMREYQFIDAPFPYECLAGYTSLYVDTYGKIYPCNSFLERKKHVDTLENGKTLKDVWNSPNYTKLRNDLLKCKACYWPCQHELNLMFSKI